MALNFLSFKPSAAFRITKAGAPCADLLPFVRAVMDMQPDRLVWGSDWPYIHLIEKIGPHFNPLAFFVEAL